MTPLPASPILLHGKITGNSAGSAPQGLDESLMLTNTDRAPMEVAGLRFSAGWNLGGTNRLDHFTRVRIRMGGAALTNGFVPLHVLATPLDRQAAEAGYWTWRFPFPTILRPQERITVEAVYVDPFTGQDGPLPNPGTQMNLNVEAVGTAGSTIVRPPLVRHVPFATAYVAPWGVSTAAYGPVASDESHLVNPYSVPLFAERLTATALVRTDTGSAALWDSSAWSRLMRLPVVTLEDSKNNLITPAPVPLYALADVLRASWGINTWLPARHFFIARISAPVGGNVANRFYAPVLGLVGSRQERI